MRSTTRVVLAAVLVTLLVQLGPALADASPIIVFDSRVGAGQNLYTTQGVHFDADDGFWAVSAAATAISFDGGATFTPLVDGTVDLRGHFLSTDTSGGEVNGHFTTFGAGPSLDLIIADSTGLLLAGTYGKRTISGEIGTATGDSHSTFNVDGGSLAALFPSGPFSGRMTNTLFGITPMFSDDSFLSDFDGNIDGRVVPEPSVLMLVGGGLVYAIRRRRAR